MSLNTFSFGTLKDWFARVWPASVDISQTDWRLRWPLLILPFLLIALLYSLFKVNTLGAQHAQTSMQLQTAVESGLLAGKALPADAADAPFSLTRFNSGIVNLADNSSMLEKWLKQGRGTQSLAQYAQAMAALATKQSAIKGVLPDLEFWNGYSDLLSILELAVIDGDIKTPEARSMVETLRSGYAQLRTTPITASPVASIDASGPANAEVAVAKPNQIVLLQGGLERLREQRAEITRIQNRALVLAALSTALFALLLWGMWRSFNRQKNASAGNARNEQSAILRLLDEITPLAQGDLRVTATVSEASTGAVADAFNFAVYELRRLVRAVTASADLVKTSVAETRESSDQLAKASSVQAREIHRSSNYLNVMSDTMAQLSAHAVESARIADLSVQQARAGNDAVQANVDGLLRIRDQAEMTTRLMQRLVETSSAINDRVKDIELVVKRTDLLALNATIRSAAQVSYGTSANQKARDSYGNSESVLQLSDDIAHLADALGVATRDIANLSDLIQQDATITLKSMSKTVSELDDGHTTARQASNSLHEIDRVSNELNGLISDIASKSLRQAGVVKQLSANMGVINNITRDSTLQLQDSARSLEDLQLITADLRASVSDFKLPRERSPGNNLSGDNLSGKNSTDRKSLSGKLESESADGSSSDEHKKSKLDSKVARNKVTHA